MAIVTTDNQHYSDIADAIREKGVSGSFKPSEMAAAIEAIPSGGSQYDEEADVCFWDYEGTLVYSCSFEEAHNMTALPTAPDHSQDEVPLTFVHWNWTLAEVNAVRWPADIGAIYTPTDGNIHWTMEFNVHTGKTATIELYDAGSTQIDWGDGTEETLSGDTLSHEYEDYGRYSISMQKKTFYNRNGDPIKGGMVVGTFYFSGNFASWLPGYYKGLFAHWRIDSIVMPSTVGTSGYPWYKGARQLKHLNIDASWVFPTTADVGTFSYPDYGGTSPRIIALNANANEGQYESYKFKGCIGLKRLRFQTESNGAPRGSYTRMMTLERITGPGFRRFNTALSSFSINPALKEIPISKNCTEIQSGFLASCPILEDVKCYAVTPPSLAAASITTNKNLKIHIPVGTLSAYQSATNWATYADYFVDDLPYEEPDAT